LKQNVVEFIQGAQYEGSHPDDHDGEWLIPYF
jgi:hypothetical protein